MAFFTSKSKSNNNGSETSGKNQTDAAMANVTPQRPPSHTEDQSAATDEPHLTPEEAQRRAAISKQFAAAFGELVTLILRSETDRKRPISDLAWMIGPGVQTGQFAIADAQSKTNGSLTPVGAILWALVSEEVDKRLSTNTAEPPRLEAQEWRSGDIPWIVVAVGDNRVIAGLIRQVTKGALKGKAPKIRSRDKDGNITVNRIELPAEDNPAQPPPA